MQKTFHLGVTMAGAVSAGAYTGGVMDYLLQTLDAFEKAKADPNNRTVPRHHISLDVISGASAGGITGGMAALALFLEDRNPVLPHKRTDEAYLKNNVFYNAWVNMTQEDMLPELLNLSDVEKEGKVVSLLNSEFIERLANQTIRCVPECTAAPPPYVRKGMELILTLSNLDGFTYDLRFSGESSSAYRMKQHRDYAFFRFGEEDVDGRIPLNLQRQGQGISELLQAAPATGAFPVGLAYRKLVRKNKYITNNPDLVVIREGVSQLVGMEGGPEDDYVSYNVDGGMLNNEPFDLTMKIMARNAAAEKKLAQYGPDAPTQLESRESAFDSTIIMIDPFPSDDSTEQEEQEENAAAAQQQRTSEPFPYSLLQAVLRVFSAMRGELLFKGEDIVRAFNNQDFSRFMIAPKRRSPEAVYNGSTAIACGSLGGFGGFFGKDFRRHDFFLGRANCQSFLRNHFRVKLQNGKPVNPLFAEGYSDEAIAAYRFQDVKEREKLRAAGKDPDSAPWYVPIIPDVNKNNEAYTETPLPFPQFNEAVLNTHKAAALDRFSVVAKSIHSAWWMHLLIDGATLFWGNRLFRQLKKKITAEFRQWKLMP